jgi:hypothetical protein
MKNNLYKDTSTINIMSRIEHEQDIHFYCFDIFLILPKYISKTNNFCKWKRCDNKIKIFIVVLAFGRFLTFY